MYGVPEAGSGQRCPHIAIDNLWGIIRKIGDLVWSSRRSFHPLLLCVWDIFIDSAQVSYSLGLSPIYTLQLAAKFGFQPRTSKPDNFGPPTLEKVQLSAFWSVLRWTVTFDIFGSTEILYYFFEHLNALKWKNSKLKSCRSHRDLQFSYKVHLHPTSYQKLWFF